MPMISMHRRWAAPLLALSIVAFAAPASADDDACIAANEAAIPLRRQGQLHAALKQLVVCADPACPDEVRTYCAKGVETLGAALPTLVFAAKDSSGNDLFAVKVTMDGEPLLDALSGAPVSVDPGAHVFRFELAGEAPVEKKLLIREGEKDRQENIVIGAPAALAALPTSASRSWSRQKTLAVGVGGVGIVGIGVGVVFGLFAVSTHDREKNDCPSTGCAGHGQATADYNAARSNALGSTIAFAAGAAFLAGGAVLWFTAPKPKEAGSIRFAPVLLGSAPGLIVGGVL
jgi:hypothetical protein